MKLILQKSDNERSTLQKCYDQKILALESKKAKLEAELSVSELSVSKMKEQFDSIKADSQSMLEISIEKIVGQKEEQYEREIQRIQQSHKHACEALEKQARERVQQCDSQHKESIEKMREFLGPKKVHVIETSDSMCLNAVVDGKNLVTHKLTDKSMKNVLKGITGLHIRQVDVSEFEKSGGSVRCMTLDLHPSTAALIAKKLIDDEER
jgi:hypothetical protein